ncbi:MAG: halocarboxylic acid dehydrogenase DehI family protein [Gammaproteobacteria bacterium]|nr:halocarboxylic acid dehydrogenase DehI family protein [Gammaproteobacteria bacterium]
MTSVAEIPEPQATGRIAELYADIRDTQGLPIVNLIWRHLATEPDALEWAWTAARPLYASGVAARESAVLLQSLSLPTLGRFPIGMAGALGISANDFAGIRRMLETYNKGNGLNLVALSALTASNVSHDATEAPPPPEPEEGTQPLPPIPALGALDTDTVDLVHAINQFGMPAGSAPLVASLYRHLGYWPGYLAVAWAGLAPLHKDGQLRSAIDATLTAGAHHGRIAARHRGPTASGTASHFARTAISHFLDTAISRMVPIGLMLRDAFEPDDAPRA